MLIKKKLVNDGYEVDCTNLTGYIIHDLEQIKIYTDCIILDKDLTTDIREQIKVKFPDKPIICLPSLDTDEKFESGITYMSEPLKLSELSEKIGEIRLKKEVEAKH